MDVVEMERRMDIMLRRQARLREVAEEDEIYIVWKKTCENNAARFERFSGFMPKRIRNILFSYADGGRLMMQRMVNIACESMEFTGEPPIFTNEKERM